MRSREGLSKGCISQLSVTVRKDLRQSISMEGRFFLAHRFGTQLLDLDYFRRGRSVWRKPPKREEGPEAQYTLKGHIPNDLLHLIEVSTLPPNGAAS